MPNSVGKTNRDVRKFLRESGVKADADNVEVIGREIRRTESENDNVERLAKEAARARGESGTYDLKGRDAQEVARRKIQQQLAQRERDRGQR